MAAKTQGKAEAPGKLILFGEHAVVYGVPALGAPLSRAAKATLSPGSGQVALRLGKGLFAEASAHAARPDDLVARALGARLADLDVDLVLDFPPMSGFGSSAALVVAVLRALEALEGRKPASPRRMLDRTLDAERVAHAHPSGVDPAICLWGGPIRFERKEEGPHTIKKLRVKAPVTLVVGSAGAHGGTRQTVSRIAELRGTDTALVTSAMQTLGAAAEAGQAALAKADVARLGRAADLAHGVLCGLGLVSAQVDEALRLCRTAGAQGGKMSGAGGAGGAFYAVFEAESPAKRAVRALRRAGHVAWIETLG